MAALSAVLRGAARADDRARKYYYEDISAPFFALDPAGATYRSQRPDSLPSSFSAVKSTDAFRVFVLGGSIAKLLGNAQEKGEIGLALKAALPSKKIELLNCGMPGYDTYREALIEQEILEYSPDLIILMTGHNEGLASAPVPSWIMRTQDRLGQWSAYRALVQKLRPADPAGLERGDAKADLRDKTFAANLSRNLQEAAKRGVKVAVVVPPRNYRAPLESDRMLYDAVFLPGWIRFLQGDYAAARRAWKEALESADKGREPSSEQKGFLWGFIARSEEKLELWEEARRSFEQAAVYDRAAICGTACQETIRKAASEEGGFLVEADSMFRKLAYPRMPDMETFNDRMHWKPQFNCLMSAEIVSAARNEPGLGAQPWSDAAIKTFKDGCELPGAASSDKDDQRILSYVLMGLSWPQFEKLSTVSVFYLQAIRRGRPAWFADVPGLLKRTKNPQTLSYGIAMAPEGRVLPRFHWHIGEVRMLEKDYAGAVKDFNRALALDPSLSWVKVSLGTAEGLRGGRERGLRHLKDAIAGATSEHQRQELLASALAVAKALELDKREELLSGDPGYWVNKAEAAVAAGRPRAAVAALDRAQGLKPTAPDLRLSGQLYAMLKEWRKLLKISDKLTKLYPDDPELWLARAEAAISTGDKLAGADALTRAETLKPSPEQAARAARWRAFMAKTMPAREAPPTSAAHWLRKAEAAIAMKQAQAALDALERARGLEPPPHELRQIAQYYRMLDKLDMFLKLSDALVVAYPGDVDLWIDRAEAALSAGRKAEAANSLAKARGLKPDSKQLRRLALYR